MGLCSGMMDHQMESQVNNEIEAAGLTGDIGFRKGERCISWLSTRHEDTDKKK